MRADRLLSLVLLLQARGRMPAHALAGELGVSVRTVYRDLDALSSAGVPIITDSGPNGGIQLLDGYHFSLRGLSPGEADALLILGIPDAAAELGLADILSAAHAKIGAASGTGASGLIHLDLPRWFRAREPVPHLRTLAEALKQRRRLEFAYREKTRTAAPLGLVNKAGVWYLVVARDLGPVVFRVDRITAARVLDKAFTPPQGFDLPAFWARWSAEFEASLPSIEVLVRASPSALTAFGEVFGGGGKEASQPDEDGFREVTLTFEHEKAAAHQLAGFGTQIEVLSPDSVREGIIATAREIVDRYEQSPLPG